MRVVTAILLSTLIGCATPAPRPIGFTVFNDKSRVKSDEQILLTLTQWPDCYAYLIDMDGRLVKKWRFDGMAATSRLGPSGLVYGLMFTPESQRKIINFAEADEISGYNQLGQKVFSLRRPGMSHDFAFVNEDKIVVFVLERLGNKDLRKFSSKSRREFAYADRISIMDLSGKELWGWSVKDHLKEIQFSEKEIKGDLTAMLTTGNSLQFIPDNPLTNKPAILASFRMLDRAVLIEYPSGKVIWNTKAGDLSRQHDASLTGNEVLVFDNNLTAEIPNLAVKQWDIKSGKLSLSWQPPWWSPLTTSVMGGARKLRNGSLLVSNSVAGNLFEVNTEGKVVWSFIFAPKEWDNRGRILGASFYRAETIPSSESYKWTGGLSQ